MYLYKDPKQLIQRLKCIKDRIGKYKVPVQLNQTFKRENTASIYKSWRA